MFTDTRRNVFLLALCQALFMTGTSMVVTVTALAGAALAPDPGLSTLPFSLQFIMTMATAIPASYLMRRFGRRVGFQLGAAVGIVGALINVVALVDGDFIMFCVGSSLIGGLNGFAIYYRFAAADCADEGYRSRAISLVLAGGVIAAFTGPNLANLTADAVKDFTFAGNFAAFAVIQVLTVVVLIFVNIPGLTAKERQEHGRPLKEILRLPSVVVAIIAGVAGYSSMSLIMSATPLAMNGMGHGLASTAFVIQWHVFAMFAPAFFTGHLIKRFGVLPVIVAGAGLIVGCMAVIQMGTGMWQFTAALMALGVGWNFMFVGGTSLLSSNIARSEQAKVQGFNDFLVFGAVAAASLFAGLLHHTIGWASLSFAVMPAIVMALIAVLWHWFARSARPV
ncbi:MAG: MFS transporter [Alphaproteobacteria bacterium]|nr:MFS transporter [Alphaproteobacteria bacterium]